MLSLKQWHVERHAVTDVGDSGLIVGKTGWVVPPKNSLMLAKAIENAFHEVDTVKWKKDVTKLG